MSDTLNTIAITATISAAAAAGTVAFVITLIAAGFVPAIIVGGACVVATTAIVYSLAKPVYMVVQRNAAGF